MASDDWRLQIDFQKDGPLDALQDRLDARELEHDLSEAFHDRVIVSRNGTTLYLYAGDQRQAEKARDLVEQLTSEDEEEQGYPQYEAQVELPSMDEAGEFAERYRSEGLPTVQRWRVVLVGAPNEDTARTLADRIRTEAPAGSKVGVAASMREAEDDLPKPFAFLGGLAG
jgi:hypothetical protein